MMGLWVQSEATSAEGQNKGNNYSILFNIFKRSSFSLFLNLFMRLFQITRTLVPSPADTFWGIYPARITGPLTMGNSEKGPFNASYLRSNPTFKAGSMFPSITTQVQAHPPHPFHNSTKTLP